MFIKCSKNIDNIPFLSIFLVFSYHKINHFVVAVFYAYLERRSFRIFRLKINEPIVQVIYYGEGERESSVLNFVILVCKIYFIHVTHKIFILFHKCIARKRNQANVNKYAKGTVRQWHKMNEQTGREKKQNQFRWKTSEQFHLLLLLPVIC